MWPYLDKAVCAMIRRTTQSMFAEYIGKYKIQAIEFEHLTLGTLPPTIHGLKVYETNEKDLVMEPAIRWAGNPNIVLVLKLMSLQVTVQLVDLQIFAAPRVALKPLVPTFPCFANILVSLMERPHVDFGLKILGGDVMSIPGLYRFVQEMIKKQVASLYLWPQTLDIPILDSSTVIIKKPVGILHVKVVRANKLLKADLLGTSDPYVKLNLTGEKLPAKKTTIKKKNLNPEWNENFKLVVKDPESQALQLQVFDWDKVGGHDRLGMQLVPLKVLTPRETKDFTLDLLKHTNISDSRDKKQRGQIVVELTYVPFREDSIKFSGPLDGNGEMGSVSGRSTPEEAPLSGAGLLSVMVQGAEDVEGKRHHNPYALVLFRGERKRTKTIKKTRDPRWNEEFQFTLDQPPLHELIRIEVMSKGKSFSFRSKESLGHVEINLDDVVYNGRINQKYHLIDSRNGVIHVEIRWSTV
ncbi:synaptotagmin-3-like isoform X2 [Populus nigra]|nr:synaptotagmin-3-like isoform X2 [Populus nigra]